MRRWLQRSSWLGAALALACGACAHALVGDPVFGTAQNVAQGGCVAQCLPGYRCDPRSKLCEREPADAGAPIFPVDGQ